MVVVGSSGCCAFCVFCADRGHALLDAGVVHAARFGARGDDGAIVVERLLHGGRTFDQRELENRQFVQLLAREGQPTLEFVVELGFGGQVDRHMQQRAARRHPQAIAKGVGQRRYALQHACEIGAPDVAAVDHANRKHLVCRPRREGAKLFGRTHEVQVHAIDRQGFDERGVVGRGFEVRRQQHLRAVGSGQRLVSGAECIYPGLREIQHQRWFVDLHPFHIQGRQALQHSRVGLKHLRQQRELVGQAVARLGQMQERHRPDERNLHAVPSGLCLAHFVEQPFGAGAPLPIKEVRREFGHEIVVVGVEPLRHFHGGVVGIATRKDERLRQRELCGVKAVARGNGAEQGGSLQHLVVPGEIAHGHEVETGLALGSPVALAQGAAGGSQVVFGRGALPERFERELQLALGADARVAEGMDGRHGGRRRGDSVFSPAMIGDPLS
jgi:hypothetical protein